MKVLVKNIQEQTLQGSVLREKNESLFPLQC